MPPPPTKPKGKLGKNKKLMIYGGAGAAGLLALLVMRGKGGGAPAAGPVQSAPVDPSGALPRFAGGDGSMFGGTGGGTYEQGFLDAAAALGGSPTGGGDPSGPPTPDDDPTSGKGKHKGKKKHKQKARPAPHKPRTSGKREHPHQRHKPRATHPEHPGKTNRGQKVKRATPRARKLIGRDKPATVHHHPEAVARIAHPPKPHKVHHAARHARRGR